MGQRSWTPRSSSCCCSDCSAAWRAPLPPTWADTACAPAMQLESLVIADPHAAANAYRSRVHTAWHAPVIDFSGCLQNCLRVEDEQEGEGMNEPCGASSGPFFSGPSADPAGAARRPENRGGRAIGSADEQAPASGHHERLRSARQPADVRLSHHGLLVPHHGLLGACGARLRPEARPRPRAGCGTHPRQWCCRQWALVADGGASRVGHHVPYGRSRGRS